MMNAAQLIEWQARVDRLRASTNRCQAKAEHHRKRREQPACQRWMQLAAFYDCELMQTQSTLTALRYHDDTYKALKLVTDAPLHTASVYRKLCLFMIEQGVPPTSKELFRRCTIGYTAFHECAAWLADNGYVRHERRQSWGKLWLGSPQQPEQAP